MRLEGIHHITAITADARRNLDFYTRVLGLRLVKKTVNQDDPTAYHLFYADERGSPGADLTFFEYPGMERGRPGAGMVHRIVWRVASHDALAFWEGRLRREGIAATREDDRLRFGDPEGLGLELRVSETGDEPLVAMHPEIPEAVALQGFDGVRAYSADPGRSRRFLEETLGFAPAGAAGFEARGARRGSVYAYDLIARPGTIGAGAVHHVAWASRPEDHPAWRTRVIRAAAGRRRSSTASTSARSISASRAGCCSRSRRSVPGSRSTSRPSASANGSRFRRRSSTCASSSSARSRRSPARAPAGTRR